MFTIPELMVSAQPPIPEEAGFACKKYRAGIVNHHALASDLLAAFFRTLQRCRPDIKTVIILSPDHFGQSSADVVSHRLPYRVSGSEIMVDEQALKRLGSTVASYREDAAPFAREHGIGALLPFLAGSSPDVRIVPVIIRSQMDEASRAEVSAWLKNEWKNPATFVVISSDMSHYLAEDIAWAKQAETDQALSTSDRDFFATAKDDHTDNGESIAAVLQALGKTKWTLLRESISSDYAGSPGFTTTYAIGFWD
ncbi:AmmeMemoRadiSam system protein B [Candidatus Uhrbacteria bacterium]|nr:AmmeMemoRadiSam system protein B [Candidatus Uhrbacteria bacterium]